MSTSHTTFRRRARRGALALMVSATMVPASSALAQATSEPAMSGDTPADYASVVGAAQTSSPRGDTPADYAAVTGSRQTQSPRGDTPADYAAVAGSPKILLPVASHAAEASGFDWTSAAIGAGAAGFLIVVSLGGATAASRLRFRTTRS